MSTRSRKGFTLIELMVVMVIIALLAAMLLPAIGDVRRRAISMKCLANMNSIGTSVRAWTIAVQYTPEMPVSPAEAVTYFQSHDWNDSVHHALYCWRENGSDGPHQAKPLVKILFPNYVKVGAVFYCPSFNRMTKADLGGSENEYVTYENSWDKTDTEWWGYEWVNPRWPVSSDWVSARYPLSGISKTPNLEIVMFCHYSVDHAASLDASGSIEAGRRWLEGDNVPFGW